MKVVLSVGKNLLLYRDGPWIVDSYILKKRIFFFLTSYIGINIVNPLQHLSNTQYFIPTGWYLIMLSQKKIYFIWNIVVKYSMLNINIKRIEKNIKSQRVNHWNIFQLKMVSFWKVISILYGIKNFFFLIKSIFVCLNQYEYEFCKKKICRMTMWLFYLLILIYFLIWISH